MPWKSPPPELRRVVNTIVGQDVYAQAEQAFLRVLAADPQLRYRDWYRNKAEQDAARAKGFPAATWSQHMLGLAVDVRPSSAEASRRILELWSRMGGWGKRYPSGLVHLQAIPPQEFRALLPRFQAAGLFR